MPWHLVAWQPPPPLCLTRRKPMNKFIVGACAGVLSLAASQYAAAQAPEKSATRRLPPRRLGPRSMPPRRPRCCAVKPEGVEWKCELGNEMYLKGDMARDQIITMYWKGKNYQLPRQMTRTGADRYFDQKTGMDLMVIPPRPCCSTATKATAWRECQTAEMAAGAPAPDASGRPARSGLACADGAGQPCPRSGPCSGAVLRPSSNAISHKRPTGAAHVRTSCETPHESGEGHRRRCDLARMRRAPWAFCVWDRPVDGSTGTTAQARPSSAASQ